MPYVTLALEAASFCSAGRWLDLSPVSISAYNVSLTNIRLFGLYSKALHIKASNLTRTISKRPPFCLSTKAGYKVTKESR